MRVAVFATVIDFGGMDRVVLNLLKHASEEVDLRPVVFTRTDTREQTFFDQLDALQIHYEKFYVNTNAVKYLNPVRNVVELARLFRRERFDVIHSHGYRADVLATILSRWSGVPAVSTCHGFTASDRNLRLYRALDVYLLRRFAHVIAVSTKIGDELVGEGLQASRLTVLPNAVEAAEEPEARRLRREIRTRCGLADSDVVFGFVGRLSGEKGVEFLVRAAPLLPAGLPWKLLLVGDGPERQPLVELVNQLGLGARVVFAGFQRDALAWYPAMDAFVLPSITEGTPLALLEAMAHGVPVIATAVGGVPAVVSDGVDGLLVPAADSARLAAAMGKVAEDEALHGRLSVCGRNLVHRRYGVDDWVRRTVDVYAAAGRRPRRLASLGGPATNESRNPDSSRA